MFYKISDDSLLNKTAVPNWSYASSQLRLDLNRASVLTQFTQQQNLTLFEKIK